MNLVDGKYLTTRECDPVLDGLDERIVATLRKTRLDREKVIMACDRLVTGLDESFYLAKMDSLGISGALARRYIADARNLFCADALHKRLRIELGDGDMVQPLGTLLHIAAGNVDGLPAFSVLEGLLTGNINILKLPAGDGGISAELLAELIREEPVLAEYVYVFDYSSRDTEHIAKLLKAADAVVVWGGDEAVASLRRMVKPNTKLIEWGHKVSFGYVTQKGLSDTGLAGFARNIAETRQSLCSSCQGIYLDTNDMNEIYALCERFLPLLERQIAGSLTINEASQAALELYTMSLEATPANKRVFQGNGCGVIAQDDSRAEPASAPYVPWVKPLPRENIISALHPYKNHLQTIGLLCWEDERNVMTNELFKTGVVRITTGERMSYAGANMPHDGEYPLRRYVKVVNTD